jgi:hypothetical protein
MEEQIAFHQNSPVYALGHIDGVADGKDFEDYSVKETIYKSKETVFVNKFKVHCSVL